MKNKTLSKLVNSSDQRNGQIVAQEILDGAIEPVETLDIASVEEVAFEEEWLLQIAVANVGSVNLKRKRTQKVTYR